MENSAGRGEQPKEIEREGGKKLITQVIRRSYTHVGTCAGTTELLAERFVF